jgi:hypothetical protein
MELKVPYDHNQTCQWSPTRVISWNYVQKFKPARYSLGYTSPLSGIINILNARYRYTVNMYCKGPIQSAVMCGVMHLFAYMVHVNKILVKKSGCPD